MIKTIIDSDILCRMAVFKHTRDQLRKFVRRTTALVCGCLLVLSCGSIPLASADELSDAKAELSDAEARLQELKAERTALEENIAKIQGEIDAVVPQVMTAQETYRESLTKLQNSAVFRYKLEGTSLYDMLLSAETFTQMLATVNYLEALEQSWVKEAEAQQKHKLELEDTMADLDAMKTEQSASQRELTAKEEEAQQVVDEASTRVDEAEAARLQSYVGGGSAGGSTYSTGVIDGSWQIGFASAYSFADNDGWDATASGIPLDWTSYTVAVPISQRYLLGSSVEISYNGMTLVATVTDVGGFAGYGRVLDLAPGVWRAFGSSDVYDWGVRQVAYRFL